MNVATGSDRETHAAGLGREPTRLVAREATSESAQACALSVARSAEGVEQIRSAWERMQWHPNSDIDYFLTVNELRSGIRRPHVLALSVEGIPSSILVGRIVDTSLELSLGYKVLHWPSVRCLTVVYAGILGRLSTPAAETMVEALRTSLARGEAEAVCFKDLPVDSPLYSAARKHCPLLLRDAFPQLNRHWKLLLPHSFSDLVQRFSAKTRGNVRRYSRRLLEVFGKDLAVRILRDPQELEVLVEHTEAVARKTYHRGIGVGFIDNPETRRLTRLALERRWYRAYLLYVAGVPRAFWHGLHYGNTFFTGPTGTDPEYARYRLGTFLLMRVFEELCQEREVEYVDFGLGDAEYKEAYSDLCWQESTVYMFAPTLKGLILSTMRTSGTAAGRLARAIAGSEVQRMAKKVWRTRVAQKAGD